MRRHSTSCVRRLPVRERGTTVTPFAAVAAAGGVLGVCCGLPVLFSLGVAGAVAGVSVSSWAPIGLGLVLAVLGGARWVRARRHTTPASCSTPTAHPGTAGLTPDRSISTTTGHHR